MIQVRDYEAEVGKIMLLDVIRRIFPLAFSGK
jgi:hypothetical protein